MDVKVTFLLEFSLNIIAATITAATNTEGRRLEEVKTAGLRLFAPEKGGSYQVWAVQIESSVNYP